MTSSGAARYNNPSYSDTQAACPDPFPTTNRKAERISSAERPAVPWLIHRSERMSFEKPRLPSAR